MRSNEPQPELVREKVLGDTTVRVLRNPNGTAALEVSRCERSSSLRTFHTLDEAQMEFHRTMARLHAQAYSQPPACPTCGEGRR